MGRAGRNRPIVAVDDTIVYDRDIPKYVDEYFYSCMERWALTKMWGLANSGGWAEQPVEYINAISTLENEYNRIESEEIEKKSSSAKSSSAGNAAKK